MTQVMHAAVILGPEEAGMIEVPRPDPAPGEVVVKIEGCGVCPSNMSFWEGRPWFRYPAPPGAPGHEGWGRVHAVGSGVSGIAEGERITFLSGNAYAEYEKVPATAVVKIPASLDSISFPGESIGCAVNVFRRSDIRAGHTVAVIGAGFLGIIVTALAHSRGAEVIAISRRRFALEMAKKYGASEGVLLDEHRRVIENVRNIIGEQGCDRVLEATGYQWPLDLAGELVRERGRIIIAGYHQDGLRQVNMQQWNWKGLDIVNAHERDPQVYLDGIREGIRTVEAGFVSIPDLVTHDFELGELGKAYATMAERPDGFIKGVIRIPS